LSQRACSKGMALNVSWIL